MTLGEVEELGGEPSDHTTSGCTGDSAFVNDTSFWLGSPLEGSDHSAWFVYGGNSRLNGGGVSYAYYGLRPVIVILKSNI